MSLFDLLKKRRSEGITWTIRTASRETVVTADGFYALIDDALTAVEEGYTEFLVLSPSMPIGGVGITILKGRYCKNEKACFNIPLRIDVAFACSM